MKLKRRTVAIDCTVDILAGEGVVPGGETFSFTFNGKAHAFYASAGVGSSMLGDLIACLYKLYIEFLHEPDDGRCRIDYDHDDPETPYRITGLGACLEFDPAGPPSVWLHLHRTLNDSPEILLDISVEELCGSKYDYRVSYFDLCYVVAREATKALKAYGFIGLCFQTEIDRIDLHQLLNVKHLGMFGRPLSFARGVPYQTHTFEEELALLCFDL